MLQCSHLILLQNRSEQNRSQLTGPTCHLQIREQSVSRLFFEHCDWIVISTTSDIASQASDTQKKYRKDLILGIGYNYFFAYHTQKKPQQTKNKRIKKKAGGTSNNFVLSCCGAVTP